MLKIIILFLLNIIMLSAINLDEIKTTIQDVQEDNIYIDVGKLKLGQTGVVLHKFKNGKIMILKKAKVITTSIDSATLQILDDEVLKEDALATSKAVVQKGDTFILNHLYNVSLLISPNFEASKYIMGHYKNNFINSDFFASYLKLKNTPVPTKKEFLTFCKNKDIGTIYMVINSTLYIVDATSFTIIQSVKLNLSTNEIQVPFYTNIKNITVSPFDFTSDKKIKNYNRYYAKLIGI